jgi:hypothetical protein
MSEHSDKINVNRGVVGGWGHCQLESEVATWGEAGLQRSVMLVRHWDTGCVDVVAIYEATKWCN